MRLWPEFQDDPEAELEARDAAAAKRVDRRYGWRTRLHPLDPEKLDPQDNLDFTDADSAGVEARLNGAKGVKKD